MCVRSQKAARGSSAIWHYSCCTDVQGFVSLVNLAGGCFSFFARPQQPKILGGPMKMQQKGFSLIELLIVVAIICIIAAIAIPNLRRSKMSANEASAVAGLRTLNTACISYSTSWGQFP